MMKLKTAFLLVLLAVSFFSFSPVVQAHNPTWWDFDWDQRLELTVNATLIDDDLENFPVLVYIDDDLVDWGDIQNNLDDIRFIDNSLGELSFEIDSFILNAEAWFWVLIPEVSSSDDTYFFMYFENRFSVSGEDAEAVWVDFVMVQHMNDETTSTILDSTSNNNDGIKKDANEPIEVTGEIAKGQDFDSINDWIEVSDSVELKFTDSFTWSFWVNPDSNGENNIGQIINKNNRADYSVAINSERVRIYLDNAHILTSTANSLPHGSYTYVAVTYDKDLGSDQLKIYINGDFNSQATKSDAVDTSNEILYLGDKAGHAGSWDGIIDEIQLLSNHNSAAWVKASYFSGLLELVFFEGHIHAPDLALRGEFIAAAVVAAFILVPLIVLVIAVLSRRK